MDKEAWRAYSPWYHKELDTTQLLNHQVALVLYY